MTVLTRRGVGALGLAVVLAGSVPAAGQELKELRIGFQKAGLPVRGRRTVQ